MLQWRVRVWLLSVVSSGGSFRFPHLVRRFAQRQYKFLATYSFLFMRVQPMAYWYPLSIVLRNLGLSLVPVVDLLVAQVMLSTLLLIVQLVSVSWFRPWRVKLANTLDLMLAVFVVFFIMATCAVGDFTGQDRAVSVAATTFVSLMGICILGGLVIVGYRVSKTLKYSYFVPWLFDLF